MSEELSKDSKPAEPPRTGSLLVIFLTVFIDLLGFGMVLPLLPLYAKSFAADPAYQWTDSTTGLMIGLLMSSFSAMQFLFVPVWGALSDRWGRRPVVIIGLLGSFVFYGLFGLATIWKSYIGLLLSRLGAGIAGATIATAQAYIADTTAREERNRGMALIGAAFAGGFTLGPALGMAAVMAGGSMEASPWPGFVAAGLSGVALLLAIFWLPESLRPGSESAARPIFDAEALTSALAIPSMIPLLASSFLTVFSFANFETTLSLLVAGLLDHHVESPILQGLIDWIHARGFTQPDQVKLIVVLAAYGIVGIILVLSQGLLVRQLARFVSEGYLATAGAIAGCIGFVVLAMASEHNDIAWLLVGMAIEVMGFALVTPSLQSLISRRADPEHQGGILGLSQSASAMARILGPMCAQPLFVRGAALPYSIGGWLMAVGVFSIAWAASSGHDYLSADGKTPEKDAPLME